MKKPKTLKITSLIYLVLFLSLLSVSVLAVPQTFSNKQEYLSWLSQNANDSKTLAGHWNSYNSTGNVYSAQLYDAQQTSGKNFSVVGADYYNLTESPAYCTTVNAYFVQQNNVGTKVVLSLHMRNPENNQSVRNDTITNFTQIFTNGTNVNKNYNAELDYISSCLSSLQNSSVYVVLDLFHEMDGSGWFWYNNRTKQEFSGLWNYTQDYILGKGLGSHIIWLYSDNKGYYPPAYYYPSDSRVDLIGVDFYGSDLVNWTEYPLYSALNKTFIITEHSHLSGGGVPPIVQYSSSLTLQALNNNFTKTAMLLSYLGKWSINQTEDYVSYLNSSRIVTLDELQNITLYANATHSSCSDNYQRYQMTSPNLPACGQNTTIFYQAIEGDTILFAQGTYRNDATPGLSISNKNYGSGVEAIAQNNNTVLNPNYADFETTNTYWVHESTLANGDKIYNTTRISTSSNTLLCTVMNISLPMFNAQTKANLSEPIFPTFSLYWDNTNDVISIRVPTWFAVSSGGLTCGKGGSAITLTNVDNLKLRNFTITPSQYAISSTSGVDNLTISGVKIYGGSNDNGLIRIESATRVNISNNFIYRADIEDYNVSWNLVKGSAVHSETSGIKVQDCDNCIVKQNTIRNLFNGIVAVGTTIGSSINLIVEQNNISGIMDDGLEPENYQHNQTWKNNTVSDAYVGVSTSPANSCSAPSLFTKNILDINRSILTALPSTYTNAAVTKAYNSQGWACWNNTQNTYLWQEAIACNGEEDNQLNNSHTKNLYLTDDNRVFDCTGLNSSGNSYSQNNIYRLDGGALARYINSISNSTDVTTLTEMQAIMPEWFTTSFSVNPSLVGYTPTNYYICSNDIGAISCSYDSNATTTNSTYDTISFYTGQLIKLNNNGIINLR